jgi:hypothetical protein
MIDNRILRREAMRSYFILAMCFLFLIYYFLPLGALGNILSIVAILAFAGSVTKASPIPRAFGVIMFTAGVFLDITKGKGIAGIVTGATMNLPLLTLVILVPLLSLPLKLGGYFESIFYYLQRLKHHPRKLFIGITSVLFFLGPILNIGSIRVIDELIKDLRLPSTWLAKAYLVGFSTTMLWSPYYASVALVISFLHLSVREYMAYGIGLALLFLVMGNLMFTFWVKNEPTSKEELSVDENTQFHKKQIIRLAAVVFTIMASTFVLEALTKWSMLVLVSLFSIVFPLLWAVLSKSWKSLWKEWILFKNHAVPVMNNEIVMYLSAGLFGKALEGSSFGQGIHYFLERISQVSFLLFAIVVVMIIVTITFTGVHQIVVVTALATQMDPITLGTSAPVLAMLLMLAWSISSVLSPANPLNLLVSRLVSLPATTVGLRANGLYLLVVSLIGLAVITILH